MKIKFAKSVVQKALKVTTPIISERSPLPILQTVLIEAKGGELTISASDLETIIITREPVDVIEEGITAIKAKEFFQLLRELPDEDITLSVENNTAKLTFSQGEYRIRTYDPDEYPEMPKFEPKNVFSLPTPILQDSIGRIAFAAAKKEGDPILRGILLDFSTQGLNMVAVDGYRLAMVHKKDIKPEIPGAVLVAAKTWEYVENIENSCEIKVGENNIEFAGEKVRIITRLMDATSYPDYKSVIPRENEYILNVQTEYLIKALRRVNIFTDVVAHVVKFKLQPDKLVITSMGEVGEAHEELISRYEGEPMDIGFNAQLLMEILNHIDTDNTIMKFKSPQTGVLILPEGKEEEILYLLMPTRLV